MFYRLFERLRGADADAEPRWPKRRMAIFLLVAALGLASIAGRLWWERQIPPRTGGVEASER